MTLYISNKFFNVILAKSASFQVHVLEQKLQPLIEKEKELTQQNDLLAAESNALRSEVKSWQSRTNQLLEQSHTIGPQEYKNMV